MIDFEDVSDQIDRALATEASMPQRLDGAKHVFPALSASWGLLVLRLDVSIVIYERLVAHVMLLAQLNDLWVISLAQNH